MSTLLLAVVLTLESAVTAPPLDVVLMVDVSHSVTFGVIRRDPRLVHDAGSALAASLEPGDAARVGTFGDEIRLDPAPLRDADAIRASADALGDRIGGPSPIWDALVTAADALRGGTGRRGIVLVTDGRSTGNRIAFADALERLRRAAVPVFVILLGQSARSAPDPGARLGRLAEGTSGKCIVAERAALGRAIQDAVAALRAGLSGPGARGR